ncbi:MULTISPECIES: phage tail length tape measure family protein [Salipiger]|nr:MULTISPECIES: phage tail length tape measure family protein [Salipiger]ALF02047.1 D-alanyl-D-alanine carboxypeptidase family protein [Thiobacimonas phage vB_ThpS-P1]GGA03677.1 hypothetical protein GCM10011326_13820 [Salipiger profundus]
MAFRVAAFLSMRGGKEAAAEVRALKGATDALKTSTEGLTTQSGAEEAALGAVGAEATRNTTIFGRLGATYDSVKRRAGDAFDRLRGGAKGAGDSAEIAAGQVGNLSAQFFDIGVMMQAGQNPLQLAVQQGSQIAQVIGPMGAAGAVRALGSAFMSLLSPVTLITVGAIAAGAAVTQWLTGSKDAAETFDDSLDALGERLDAYRKYADLAGSSTKELEERFGSAAAAAREFLPGMAETRLRSAQLGVTQSIETLLEELGIGAGSKGLTDEQSVAEELGVSLLRAPSWEALEKNRSVVEELIASYEQLGTVAEGSSEEQLAAVQRVLEAYRAGAELSKGVNDVENARIQQLETLAERIAELQGQEQPSLESTIPQSIRDQADAAGKAYLERRKMVAELEREIALSEAILQYGEQSAEVEALRVEQAQEVLEARLKEKGWLPQIIDQVLELNRIELDRAQAVRDAEAARGASNQIAQLRSEAEINRAIVTYGRDSVEVKRLQIAAQRQLLEQMLQLQDITEAQKDQWREAWEAANGLASADPFGALAASADYLRQADLRIEKLRLEQDLLGQTEAVRTRLLALYEAEVQIRQQGLDRTSARADEVRAAVLEEAELTRELGRQAQAWDEIRNAGTQAIDDIFDRLMERDFAGALTSVAEEISRTFTDLGLLNPLKNDLFGTDLPTMQDLGGWQGIWDRLTGGEMPTPDFSAMEAFSTPAMSVTAMNVTIGGPGLNALAGAGGAATPAGMMSGSTGPISAEAAALLKSVSTGGALRPDAISNMDPKLAGPLAAMIAEAQGIFGSDAVQVNSAYRSVERQTQLWEKALAKYGNPAEARKWVAPPGNSRHNFGLAADLQYGSSSIEEWFHANAGRFGLGYRMDNEPWHIEPTAASLAQPAAQTQQALDALATTAVGATQNLGTLGSGFDMLGSVLSSLTSGGAGGGAGGGWIGSLIGAIFSPGEAPPANADGGYQYFPGGSRADTGLIRISSGEFVVNGAATARNRGLLEWINSGGDAMASLPARANGGGFASGGYDAGPREVQIVTPPGVPMSATLEEEPMPGGGRRERYVLAEMVGGALSMPGGAARRTMRNAFGVRPKGALR